MRSNTRRPANIRVTLDARRSAIKLAVSDDGIGITDETARPDGMGLRIMSYRAGLIHGKLDVRRSDTGGTLVSCLVIERTRAWNKPSGRGRVESYSSPAKVLIVDDHPAVREGIMSRISRQSDLIVCGEAATSPRPCGWWKPPSPTWS